MTAAYKPTLRGDLMPGYDRKPNQPQARSTVYQAAPTWAPRHRCPGGPGEPMPITARTISRIRV